MSIRIPVDNDILDVRMGPTGASEVYLGDILVWPLGCCGVTLNLPLNETPIEDKSRTRKGITSATGLVATAVGSPPKDCIDFTSGAFLRVNYPTTCNFFQHAFAIECDVFLANGSDVITLFERPPENENAFTLVNSYNFRLQSTYVSFQRATYSGTGPDACGKLFLPYTLQTNKWYRVVVQRSADYRLTVYVQDLETGVVTIGTTYTPACGHPFVETFRADFGAITGQYFHDASFAADAVNDIKIGGAGYIANYKVTVCQGPYAGPAYLPEQNTDADYTSASLLLHLDDLDGQEFIDSGPYGLVATKVGSPSIVQVITSAGTNNVNGMGKIAGSFGSGNSIWGAGNFITYPDAPPGIFDLGDGSDFTIEFWAQIGGGGNPSAGGPIMGYLAPVPAGHYGNRPSGWVIGGNGFGCSQGCNGATFFFSASGPTITTHFYGGTGGAFCTDTSPVQQCPNQGLTITANGYYGVYSSFQFFPQEWNHYAVTKAGNTIRIFFNGKVVAYGPTLLFPAEPEIYKIEPDYLPPVLTIGGGSAYSPASAVSKLKEVRITKGVARYTANFALQSRLWPDESPTPNVPDAPTWLNLTQL